MAGGGDDRGAAYRRRLIRAAVASLVLHTLFFSGLTVSRLELALEPEADPEARAPQEPKRAADFRLQVSRSPAAERPAHERPLPLPLDAETPRPVEARERPVERSVADRRAAAPEAEAVVAPTEPTFERSRPVETPPSPEPAARPARITEATPAEPQAAADLAAAGAAPATEAASQPVAAPAALQPRERAATGAVAARWRPREVALLEKLTVRAPEATSLAARPAADAPTAASAQRLPRSPTAAATGAAAAQADPIAPPTAAAQPPAAGPAVAPSQRQAARPTPSGATASRRPLPAAESAAESSALPTTLPATSAPLQRVARAAGSAAATPAGSLSAGSVAPARASAATAGQVSATAPVALPPGGVVTPAAGRGSESLAPAAGRPARQTAAGSALAGRGRATGGGEPAGSDATGGDTAGGGAPGGDAAGRATAGPFGGDLGSGLGGGRAGLAGAPAAAAVGSAAPGRDAGGIAAGSAATAALTPAADGQRSGGGASAAGGAGPSSPEFAGLAPAAVARAERRERGRSALAPRGTAAAVDGGAADGAEGLSVSPADLAALAAVGRDRGGLPERPAGPRSLARVAAAALPTDGRVRDVAEAFAGRSGAGGEPAGGITDREVLDRARAVVDRGLGFLARSQRPDGRWRLGEFAGVTPADVPKLESDTAATGLALLCFLGAGHDHFSGTHRDTVRRGLEFLMSVQKDDGDLFLPADDLSNSCSWLYSHGIAAIAVCEAVGMTGDPRVTPAAEKACRFIATSRHPTLGGWRYLPRTDADLSVSGWMLVALRAGDLAGVPTDPAALEGVRTLLAAAASPSDPTRFAYNPRKTEQRRADLSVACMTAVGTLMRLHTGATADDPGVAAAARALVRIPPSYGTQTARVRDSYLWYYASQVLVHTGGPDWERWYATLGDTLAARQETVGPAAGSWDAMGDTPDRWGEYGGRVYVTTLHLLALEVPWRHLPTYATSPAR